MNTMTQPHTPSGNRERIERLLWEDMSMRALEGEGWQIVERLVKEANLSEIDQLRVGTALKCERYVAEMAKPPVRKPGEDWTDEDGTVWTKM